jgi:hypothetical protein
MNILSKQIDHPGKSLAVIVPGEAGPGESYVAVKIAKLR